MILLIDNYDSFSYNLVQALRTLGAEVEVVRNDAIDTAGIAAKNPQAIVLSPGPGNPDSAGVTLAAVKAFAGKIPMLGVCLGHQSVAQAFGARIVPAARLVHGKTSRIRHDGKGLFEGVEQGFSAMRYHSLAVDRDSLPPELEVTATSEDGEIMGLRHREFPIETVQYHPESIGTPSGMRQLGNFVASLQGGRRGKCAARPARKAILARAVEGECPSEEEAEGFFTAIMSGEVGEIELAGFLTALAKIPVTAGALAGAARAMAAACVKVDIGGADAVDIVGTGGDGAGTFNVSTTAAFVAAGAGATVAKHGNVASTSACGSADVLAALGMNLLAGPDAVARSVAEAGIGFLFARELHPAMRFAAPARRTLGFRTVFNLLGPLANPAGVKRIVVGVPNESLAPVFADALSRLGAVRALAVAGAGGVDEISPDGYTFVSSLKDGAVRTSLLDAGAEYGARYSLAQIAGGDAAHNARILLSVLRGEDRGAYRAAACENAAAAILAAGRAATYAEALAAAAESIDSGRALRKLEKAIECSKS